MPDVLDIKQDFLGLIEEYGKLPKPNLRRTFMQISGYPHYENVCSNILQFFLKPDNEHGLKDLLLRAFLMAIGYEPQGADLSQGALVIVEREETTKTNKRLDLLISCSEFVLGVENKIYAELYNDLEEYGELIADRAKSKQDAKPLKAILTLWQLPEFEREKIKGKGFIPITYKELFKHVKYLSGTYMAAADIRYLVYLNDFIRTIESLQGDNMENQKAWSFFKEHAQQVEELIRDYNKFKEGYLAQKIEQLREIVTIDNVPTIKQRVFQSCTLVHEFFFPKGVVALDTFIAPSGWTIEIIPRPGRQVSEEWHEIMKRLENKLELKSSLNESGTRIRLASFPVDEKLDVIADRLKAIIDDIRSLLPHPANKE